MGRKNKTILTASKDGGAVVTTAEFLEIDLGCLLLSADALSYGYLNGYLNGRKKVPV